MESITSVLFFIWDTNEQSYFIRNVSWECGTSNTITQSTTIARPTAGRGSPVRRNSSLSRWSKAGWELHKLTKVTSVEMLVSARGFTSPLGRDVSIKDLQMYLT